MPLHEYRCAKCGKTFEKIQKFSDKPKAKCPECGVYAQRQISAPAIRFKGTGWYVTDYAGKGKSGDEQRESDKKPAEGKDSSKDSSKDSKSKKGS